MTKKGYALQQMRLHFFGKRVCFRTGVPSAADGGQSRLLHGKRLQMLQMFCVSSPKQWHARLYRMATRESCWGIGSVRRGWKKGTRKGTITKGSERVREREAWKGRRFEVGMGGAWAGCLWRSGCDWMTAFPINWRTTCRIFLRSLPLVAKRLSN